MRPTRPVRPKRPMPVAERVAAVAGAVTVLGMVATPLARQGGAVRRVLSNVVVAGMFTTTTANAVRRWGAVRGVGTAGLTAVATGVVERVGTHTGLPFGRYGYTAALRPQVQGVPVIVPLAWFAMALPAREAAVAALGPTHSGRRVPRTLLGSAALTAWDLFLDPQMVGEGYWRWARRGAYRAIPASNFVGWFVTGLGVMAALDTLLPHPAEAHPAEAHPAVPERGGADGALVGQYAFMAAMETVGFAKFFRDPLVAAVGGAAMLPIAGAAVARFVR